MLILDLTVSVKPKEVLEWKYFILPGFHLSFVNSQMAAMSIAQIMCDVKFNLKKYYLHDKLPIESIISMLSNAKMLT